MATKQTSILTAGTNNHQTTAEEANQFATDFVQRGVLGALGNTNGVAPATGGYAVNAQGTPNMTVAVAAGSLYSPVTPSSQASQMLRTKMLTSEDATINPNSSGVTKYDFIYIAHDAANANNPNVSATDVATIVVSRSSNAVTDDGTPPAFGELLATVTVINGAVSITNGNIRDRRTSAALASASTNTDWISLTSYPLSWVQNDGSHQSVLKLTGVNIAASIPLGAKFKMDRVVAPSTQCMQFISSSSQYANRASGSVGGLAFTTTFSAEAWIKQSGYSEAVGTIISRRNGAIGGWGFRLSATGTVELYGGTASAFDLVASYRSIGTDRWHFVSGTMNMATSSGTVYIDGELVNSLYTNSASTVMTQSGDLIIGAANTTGATIAEYGNFQVHEVRLWSNIQSQAQILANMGISLVGNEANLVGLWKGAGNFNDSTANANNLSSVNGAVATSTGNGMNATETFVAMKVEDSGADTLITGFFGLDNTCGNTGLYNCYYSTRDTPLGFDADTNRWIHEAFHRATVNTSLAAINTWYASPAKLIIGYGRYDVGYDGNFNFNSTVAGTRTGLLTMSDTTPTTGLGRQRLTAAFYSGSSTPDRLGQAGRSEGRRLTASTTAFNIWGMVQSSTGVELYQIRGGDGIVSMFARCGYIK